MRTDTYAVADLDILDIFADFDGMTHNLMSDHEGKLALSPALRERVEVGTAHAAMGNGDLDVVRLEGLGFDSCNFEV